MKSFFSLINTVVFEDSNNVSAGITYDGKNAWVSLHSHIKSVDLTTGEWGKSYDIGMGTEDLAWTGEELVLLDTWNKVTLVNPVNGIVGGNFSTPCKAIGYSGDRGVAARQDEIWVINTSHYEICILDMEGNHIGVAEVDFIAKEPIHIYNHLRMCFMGEKLVIALEGHVLIYNVTRIE